MSKGPNAVRTYSTRDPYFSSEQKIVVFRLDPDAMTFQDVSGNVLEFLGFPVERWSEPGFWPERIHPDDRADALEYCLDSMRDRRDHALEYRVVANNGRVIWVYETIDFTRTVTGEELVRGFIVDITERVAHEGDVRSAFALRDELLAIVTKEISEPIQTVSGFAAMLERHLAQQGDHVGSDYAIGMRDGIERLTDITSRLMRAAQRGEMGFEETNRQLDNLRQGLLDAR